MMNIRFKLFAIVWLLAGALSAQPVLDYSTGAILQKLEQVNTLGSVLYIAAHPDDENTQLIAYLANGMHFRTGYLAATRGDGGQNLIGPEIREELGLIRTEELLAARSVDHGEQFFSRANDFGFSKNPDETFHKWDKEKVLADFVWTIRKFRPDILITRFSQEPGVTHGHHTASAILAMEAFKLSADPKAFPEQLKYVEPWQPKKIFWNTNSWFFRNKADFNASDYVTVDVGAYNPYLGKSYTEISALSRSMHKSQGFGVTGVRGSQSEYFEQWGGDETGDLFGGIDTSWKRVKDAENVAYFLEQAREEFDPAHPEAILGYLLNARDELNRLPDQYWKTQKLAEIRELVLLITGTYMEFTTAEASYTPGDTATINLELINRSEQLLQLSTVSFSVGNEQFSYNQMDLKDNAKNQIEYRLPLPATLAYTSPYWLEQPGTDGMYRVDDQLLIGKPENPAPITASVTLSRDSQQWTYDVPVIYKMNDPVRGEVRKPLVITPPVLVNLGAQSFIFGSDAAKEVKVRVIAGEKNVSGEVALEIPKGWKVLPASQSFSLARKGEEAEFVFSLTPGKESMESEIRAVIHSGGQTYSRGRVVIDYDHIPAQELFPQATARVVKLNVKTSEKRIGYIMGAGDEVPEALMQVGYTVDLLDKDQINPKNLEAYGAIVVGVRAFNTLPWLAYKNKVLFEYVEKGGTLVVQYNTFHRLVTEDIAPYMLHLSNERVTVEEAPVSILDPKCPVLNVPNKIERNDFEGWVQERGLYFPNQWAAEFVPVLGMNDPGESELDGSLLVAKYGKGYYCYTGLSLFRELPAGVAGAYKLLINMVSLGDHTTHKNDPGTK